MLRYKTKTRPGLVALYDCGLGGCQEEQSACKSSFTSNLQKVYLESGDLLVIRLKQWHIMAKQKSRKTEMQRKQNQMMTDAEITELTQMHQ